MNEGAPHFSRPAEMARTILFCVLAAIGYGILHDMVTAHVCVEYFTIAHPPVFDTESPFLLALGWGILATWWVGLPLGIGLALAAQLGPNPVRLLAIRIRIIRLLIVCALSALVSGVVGATLASAGSYPLTAAWLDIIPADRHVRFAFAAWAHIASYIIGAIGGLALIVQTALMRVKAHRRASQST